MMVSDVHLCDRDGVVLIYNYKKKKKKQRQDVCPGDHMVGSVVSDVFFPSFVSFPHHRDLVQVQASLLARCR